MKYGQLVVGPAGSGKTTYCKTVQEHLATCHERHCFVVNLDPAADSLPYSPAADIRELIDVKDAAEELRLGPNGALVYCMEFLADNLHEWLAEQVQGFNDDDYILFDCPGQAELYEHLPTMRSIVNFLETSEDFRLCTLYVLDAGLVNNASRFVSGVLAALSAMALLELPHISILTKVDLLGEKEKEDLEAFLEPEATHLLPALEGVRGNLDMKIAQLLDDYSQVSFLQFDISEEESISDVIALVDNTIQFGEDADVVDRMPGADDDIE